MAVRKTTKKSDDSKLIRTIPGKYALIDNADKTNKALAEKREREKAARSKKDAKSQKRGLKAANKPLKKTLARTGATFAASERARAAREAYKQGKGPKLTAAQRIALNRGTILDLPKPPGRLKRISNAADRISIQATERAVEKKRAKAATPKATPKRRIFVGRGGGGRGGMLGGGGGMNRTNR